MSDEKYRVYDGSEHGCCWDAMIITDCEEGKGEYGKNYVYIAETDKDHAQLICDALNCFERKKE